MHDPHALALADVTISISVEDVAMIFPFTPRPPIRRHLPHVLAALRDRGLTTGPLVLAALATIRAETEGFVPIAERPSRFNTSPGGAPFDRYDGRADLGNQGPPDGARFKGRGFVQLTGRANYARFGEAIGLGRTLLDEPDLACEPAIAARLLAAFLAAVRPRLDRALAKGDLAAARRLVNGGSHGLDRFSDAWRRGRPILYR